jgi:sulfite reductase (NADPH) flavoprotein alpha-component
VIFLLKPLLLLRFDPSTFSLAQSFLSVFSVRERFEAVPGPLSCLVPRYFATGRAPALEEAFKSQFAVAIEDLAKLPKMQLKQETTTGGIVPVPESKTAPESLDKTSAGAQIPLGSISGPTYVTSQLLVQQTAYKLSDKIFSFSPETFDLDHAVKEWSHAAEKNIHGETTTVVPLQTRAGAGTFALGYIFSKDFDLSKRHIPQTLLAPSLSLRHLRAALDQLSLLYAVASPFVAHIAAADYSAQDGLITEYESALQIAEDLGLGLVSSASAYEAQHMSLLATLLASLLPTLHVYDGLRTARETLRVVDALSEGAIADIYKKIAKEAGNLNKRLDTAGKVVELLRLFNSELGTSYAPFEYHGHEAPELVLVVFGSAEAQLAKQVVNTLAAEGTKVGAINVRIYRPFIEEAFLEILSESVRQIAVLGQVRDSAAVDDASVQSALYSDVLTAVSFADRSSEAAVVDVKYAASTAHTPSSIASIIHRLTSKENQGEVTLALHALEQVRQYTFWDVDNSAAVAAPVALGKLLAREAPNNVYVHDVYDNLVQGGAVRTDIRSSEKPIEAPFAIDEADVVFVGEEKLLKDVDVISGSKSGSRLILRLPNFKPEDLEKRISAPARKQIQEKGLELFVLDSSFSPALEKDAQLLAQLAFLQVARPDITLAQLSKIAEVAQDQVTLAELSDALQQALKQVEVPAAWAEAEALTAPLAQLKRTSFVPFQKDEPEPALKVDSFQEAAKGLVFKEAYGTQIDLRPDLTVKTFTITVKENRRLTPLTYDRNIFHIEFDLGDSGLTYNIGEALGVHADNDVKQVLEFIEFYGLNADDLVQVPSREDPTVFETRTVYQSLVQNVDILGKPPKRFFESLAEFATDEAEKKKLEFLGGKEGAEEFKRLSEVETVTYVDVLQRFQSAHPAFADLVRIVSPLKRREYSIASAQAVTPNSVSLMIVVVDWVDAQGRKRYGQASRYLSLLKPGTAVTASVKPSVMKLPTKDTAPLIMAGLGTGLAPFRAFVQYRAMQKAQGKDIGAILLYLGSRHQREEYLYGEEWEAYVDAGVITLLGAAFSRDQPQKIYIQDRMRQTIKDIVKAYISEEGSFYLCGPTWPVPDVTAVLEEAIAVEAKESGRKVDPRKEIERLKEDGRYVLEVY